MWDWIKRNESVWGTICWPLSAAMFAYRGEIGMVAFCMFWAGVAVDRFITNLN